MQGAQIVPPQSGALSVPFVTPSWHVGVVQKPFVQPLKRQSVLTVHVLLMSGRHFGQPGPPQSMSLSVPSLMLLAHAAGKHVLRRLPIESAPLGPQTPFMRQSVL